MEKAERGPTWGPVGPLDLESAALLSEEVLFRIVRGDAKGRSFGIPRNDRVPSYEEFNPRLAELDAGDVARAIRRRKHGIFVEQAERIGKMLNEDLLRFRLEDPISGVAEGDGFHVTGGHHRLNEITRRVELGTLAWDMKVKVLLHD